MTPPRPRDSPGQAGGRWPGSRSVLTMLLLARNGADHVMTLPACPGGELPVAVANLEYGGLSEDGGDGARGRPVACLAGRAPQVVLLQEVNGRAAWRLQAHLWRTANKLGMTPVPGPPSPDSVSGSHPEVLVRTAAGLQVLDAGPPAGAVPAAWCEAPGRGAGPARPGVVHQRPPALQELDQAGTAGRAAGQPRRPSRQPGHRRRRLEQLHPRRRGPCPPRKGWKNSRCTCARPACARPPAASPWHRITGSTPRWPASASPMPPPSCHPPAVPRQS